MEWDEAATGWDDEPLVRDYARAAYESLQQIAAMHDLELTGLDVCDFGCGTGLLSEALAPANRHIDAIDISPRMLAVLDTKIAAHAWGHVDTMSEIPAFTPGDAPRYDLIVCSSVCSFLDDYPATTRQLVALLRPGGLFVQWDWEINPSDEEPHGLSRDDIAKALATAGLTSITVDVGFELAAGGDTMRPLRGAGVQPLRAGNTPS